MEETHMLICKIQWMAQNLWSTHFFHVFFLERFIQEMQCPNIANFSTLAKKNHESINHECYLKPL